MPPPHGGNPSDPDHLNLPDGGSDGRGRDNRGIPEDLAELPKDPLLALTRAIHALTCLNQHSGDSALKTKRPEDMYECREPSILPEEFEAILAIETIMLQSLLKLFLQNLKVKVPIHPTINLGSIANTLPSHATPHHQRTPSKLESPLYQPIIEPSPAFFQAHLHPSDPR
ncbi:hypothetical protein EDD17DRAFT_1763307 [Pisolithus thermaeus]|nr:hypothetical protein EDD17DRAFT_1763307 [Pisolithus thermaeus]